MTPEEVKRLAQDEKAKCEELEDLAFRGAELPKGLPFPQELLFLKFRYLYQYAKITQMQPEQGKREPASSFGRMLNPRPPQFVRMQS